MSIFDRIVEYSNISKPSERIPKEDGGMLVKPSADGSRPCRTPCTIEDRRCLIHGSQLISIQPWLPCKRLVYRNLRPMDPLI